MIAPYPLRRLDNRILEIIQGPENRLATRRTQRLSKKPEVYLDHEIIFLGPRGHRGTRRFSIRYWDHDWSPEAVWEPRDSSIDPETILGIRRSCGNPEVLRDVMTPMHLRLHRGTVLRLPRQDYYRKSLTCLEGAGVGVMTQELGFDAFHVWISIDYEHVAFYNKYFHMWYSRDPDAP
ncbi:hypothetical protein F2Q69_00005727 [Brassica cretica]|uniref:Uncharacterized protein n=1 Tax=Brassica cretica TaxID=69181 RepID=A0A8S9PJZ4_BRACR|nr:hypothetical protein F2Q69_00005727 [Brassica cretica]